MGKERTVLRGGAAVPNYEKFLEGKQNEEIANRTLSETYLTCVICGYQTAASALAGTGQKTCPRCGTTTAPRRTCLPYPLKDQNGLPIAPNPPPTDAEIKQLDRLREPGGVQ
jgi:hypothetical protein